jgi:glycosyltransferase involved in cell wall biosynthesis
VDVGRFSSQSPEASADLRIRLGISADTAVMMMVGRLEPEKDWWTFLRVAEIVGRRAPGPCAFLAVGWGGEEAALLRYTRERGLTQVHFLGYRDDIPALLAASDMFLLTSRMEPFGIALIEAMAAGVPVLATRSGGPESIITDGDDGVLVPVGDDETMAARVLDLLADPERRAWIGRRGRATVNHRYSMPIMLDRLARLYADLVGHTPG